MQALLRCRESSAEGEKTARMPETGRGQFIGGEQGPRTGHTTRQTYRCIYFPWIAFTSTREVSLFAATFGVDIERIFQDITSKKFAMRTFFVTNLWIGHL
jgi:hypothetical protein